MNGVASAVLQDAFEIPRTHVISMDLKNCLVNDAKNLIRRHLETLGKNVIVVGHSAGGQLGTHFVDHANVELVISMCGPSHNPLDYPIWLWPKTGAYLGKTLSNQNFHLPADLSEYIFGMAPPDEFIADSRGHLVAQMNFGGFCRLNPAPPKPRFGTKLLCVSSTGDNLVTQGSVEKTTLRLGAYGMSVCCNHHFIHIGRGGERRMRLVASRAQEMVFSNQMGGFSSQTRYNQPAA